MADKDLLYFNQTSAQWELINAGAISDGTTTYNPTQVTAIKTTADAALPKSGGVVTGNVTIDKNDPSFILKAQDSGHANEQIKFTNYGGQLEIQDLGTSGTWVKTLLAINRANGNMTYKGDIMPQLRYTNGYIEWYNGTIWQGVGGVKNIQRGLYAANPGTNNVTISAVSSLSKASANLLSVNVAWTDGSSGTAAVTMRLTSTTNLEIVNGLNGVAVASVSWEVIEYY